MEERHAEGEPAQLIGVFVLLDLVLVDVDEVAEHHVLEVGVVLDGDLDAVLQDLDGEGVADLGADEEAEVHVDLALLQRVDQLDERLHPGLVDVRVLEQHPVARVAARLEHARRLRTLPRAQRDVQQVAPRHAFAQPPSVVQHVCARPDHLHDWLRFFGCLPNRKQVYQRWTDVSFTNNLGYLLFNEPFETIWSNDFIYNHAVEQIK